MIIGHTDSKQYLYHYTKAVVATDYILKDFTLRLSSFTKTNDPKETKPWEFSLSNGSVEQLSSYKLAPFTKKLNGALKSRTKILCFSQDYPNLSGYHISDISFRGFARPRMWSHYAEDHKGVCLVFDRKKLDLNFNSLVYEEPLGIFGPVEYRDGSPMDSFSINVRKLEQRGFDEFCWDYIKGHHKILFFQKMTDWATENEYRYLIFREDSEDLLLPIDGALRGVIVGEDASQDSIDKIFELVASKGAEIMGLKWKNGSPWYDYGNPTFVPAFRNR